MTDRKKFFTIEPVMKEVGKDEFTRFIEQYPRPLRRDVFGACDPPLITYNDFALANRWPHSIVASTYLYEENPGDYLYEPEGKRKYSIMVNHEDCFNSKTGYEE